MFGRLHIAHQEIISDFGYYHFVRMILQQQSREDAGMPEYSFHCWVSRLLEDAC
jgi:hypothetical protein